MIPRHVSSTPYRLSAAEGRSVWTWVLGRQGVGVESTLRSAHDVAEVSLGLHAARVGSPYTIVATRLAPDVSLAEFDGLLTDERLTTIRCMRQTLHTLTPRLVGICHAATQHYRLRTVRAMSRREGVPLEALPTLVAQIESELAAHAYLTHRQLEQQLTASGVDLTTARVALRFAWEAGRVVYRNRAPSWHQERRTFGLPAGHHEAEAQLTAEAAQLELLREYLDRYGPATIRDAAWWAGLSLTDVAKAVAQLDVIAILTPWSSNPAYMLTDRYEQWRQTGSEQHSYRSTMLAHEDVALKAYFETRSRYLGGVPARRAFNSIGEVRPVVITDGQVVGRWTWDTISQKVRYSHFAGIDATVRKSTRIAAANLTVRLRAGLN